MKMLQQYVSLTSQGQISIPRAMLKKHKVKRPGKVVVTTTKTGWHVEPAPSFWDLAGSLHKYAIKGKKLEEILALEEGAWEREVVKRYKKLMVIKK